MARDHDREIVRLAWPAFLALVAEPLFLLSDAAIVGHLGTPQLAGLGIAAVVLQTAGRAVRLPRLRHHRERGAAPRGRRPRRRPGPGHRRHLARGPDRRRRDRGRCRGLRSAGGGLRGGRRGRRPRRDVPADRAARGHAAAGHARQHRRAPRPAGHPHPAGRRRRRQRAQHRAQPGPRLRRRQLRGPRDRRLGHRVGGRAGPERRRAGRGRGGRRASRGRATAPGPGRHPSRRSRRRTARGPDAHPAGGTARHDVRRGVRQRRRPAPWTSPPTSSR